ncbi:nitroreductase family protein [Streptosporangium sp. NPDC051023]|uniref:nitroreductase family protein n=1 Tax=Streptosporangium sp. NPDC051023 TaxID=3155410 RepID=UPI003450BD49
MSAELAGAGAGVGTGSESVATGGEPAGAAGTRYVPIGERVPFDAIVSVDWRLIPPTVKRYTPGHALALPSGSPLGRILRGAGGLIRYQWNEPQAMPGQQGTLLITPGRPLRPVPSGGSLYPGELYALYGGRAFHYDPAAHALDPLPGTTGVTDQALALTGVLGRTAFKYGDFGYRLLCLEGGILVGQVLAMAEAEGREARLRAWFDDEAVETALGLDPEAETVNAVIDLPGCPPPLGGGSAAEPTPRTAPRPVTAGLPATSALHAAIRGQSGAAVAVPYPDVPAGAGIPLPDVQWRPSGDPALRSSMVGRFGSDPMTLHEFAVLLRAATGGWQGELSPRHVVWMCAVHEVTGLERGAYAYDPVAGELVLVKAGDLRIPMWPGGAVAGRFLGDQRAGVVLVPMGDYAAGLRAAGDRWYRLQNLVAGIGAQRAGLAAADLGLSSRITCAYHAETVREALGVTGGTLRPLCQILAGSPGPEFIYQQAIS